MKETVDLPIDNRDYSDLQGITKEKQIMQVSIKLDRIVDLLELLSRSQPGSGFEHLRKADVEEYRRVWHVTQ